MIWSEKRPDDEALKSIIALAIVGCGPMDRPRSGRQIHLKHQGSLRGSLNRMHCQGEELSIIMAMVIITVAVMCVVLS